MRLADDQSQALKPYSAMKDSGVPLLGEVPEHWQVRRLGSLGAFSASGIDKKTVDGEPFVRMVNYLDIYRNATHALADDRAYMVVSCPAWKRHVHDVRSGDMFFTPSSETSEDIGCSAVAVQDIENGVYSYHVIRFRPSNPMALDFQKYWCNCVGVLSQFSAACKGTTRQILTRGDFRSIAVVVPPLAEQEGIGRFLDHVDRRIRRYIRAKQKLIKLLEEQKQAIIHRAVTRGLDPNVRLKPSGVEWLGDVPEHWTLKRFKFIGRVSSGQIDPRAGQYRKKVLIAPNHIKSGTGKLTHLETAEAQGADSGKYEVAKGQIIYSKIRPNLRKAIIAPVDCLCSADAYPISVNESEVRSTYFLLLLLSAPFTKYAVDCSLRVAMPKLNREALGECWFWYPPVDEQAAILSHLERCTSGVDPVVARTEREIALLREYRTRLIADVVTGKLDVREAAAGLPHDLEPAEALDEMEEPGDIEDTMGEDAEVAVGAEE